MRRALAWLCFVLGFMSLGYALAWWVSDSWKEYARNMRPPWAGGIMGSATTGTNSGPPKDDPSDMRMQAQCHVCKKALYRDGPVWRHVEGADPLFPHWASPIPPGTAQHLVEGSFE